MVNKSAYPGIRVTTDGNHLVSYLTEVRYTDGGAFYPITASTQMGEDYQLAYSHGSVYAYTVAHWALTEGRFRNHCKRSVALAWVQRPDVRTAGSV